MAKERDVAEEVLCHLESLSKNLIIAENIHQELSLFRQDTNSKIIEMKEDFKELRGDFKEMHKNIDGMEKTLIEFKNEMKPIIDFKNHIQQQIIKYSSMAFLGLLATTIGMSRIGI